MLFCMFKCIFDHLILDAKMKRVGIVSPKEIAKDQGKPISKYERNMMIFDWLHTLGNINIKLL